MAVNIGQPLHDRGKIAEAEFFFDKKNTENSMERDAMQRGILKKMGAEIIPILKKRQLKFSSTDPNEEGVGNLNPHAE